MLSTTLVSVSADLARSPADETDVCAAFAASFLIRIARLFPNELNLKKTAKDVEELAGILSEGKPI
jgi:hypothetical protein